MRGLKPNTVSLVRKSMNREVIGPSMEANVLLFC